MSSRSHRSRKLVAGIASAGRRNGYVSAAEINVIGSLAPDPGKRNSCSTPDTD